MTVGCPFSKESCLQLLIHCDSGDALTVVHGTWARQRTFSDGINTLNVCNSSTGLEQLIVDSHVSIAATTV